MRILIFTISLILMFGCSGEEVIDPDTTPPLKPNLIHHLGDTGDGEIQFNGETITLSDENNGTDAVPYGDHIRIMWNYLEDNDLDYIKINRFDLYNETPVVIDSIISDGRISYTDLFVNYGNPIGREWYYFIEVFDRAGNSSISDTTSYELTQKPILIHPQENEIIAATNLYWKWETVSGVDHYRLLLFNSNQDLEWSADVYESTTSGDSVAYSGDDFIGTFFGEWRVDAIVDNNPTRGSESKQRQIRITQ